MKKLITILFLFSFALNAQISQDKTAHFSCGFLIGGIANIETYNLIKNTNLKPHTSKIIAFVVGAGVGILAGHLKETYDSDHEGFYNPKDLNSTLYGALAGSITVRLVLWNSVPESHVPIEDLWLQDQPLVEKYND